MTRARTTLQLISAAVTLSALGIVPCASAQQAPAQQTPAAQTPLVRPLPAPPDVAAPPDDAEKSKSGLATKVVTPGTGTTKPGPDDTVTVQYTGWRTDGTMFDSSYARAKASTFPLNRVIKGWSEGVQLMVVGEKRRMWIPDTLAYKGMENRPQGTLVFDVELVSISEAPKTPPDVAKAPADGVKTKSGLVTRVLTPGTGTDHPKKSNKVTVHYSGWTTDGKMFDSSVLRGQPASFPLDQVIAGWTEGVQLMVVGEKRRMWIPERLAYDGAEGKPKGMLVFDVELVSFTDNPTIPPPDVKGPPSDAKKTASSLAYKTLKEGIGGRRPKADSTVTVNYSGWTTDGKLFDSSAVTGKPATFTLVSVVPGWAEGLQLMVEGQKMRLWVPENLAYQGKRAPYGMLVFDVELLKIEN
jgi:FKBP-type peptidyl-prolyl cis-trans isomerase